MLVVKTFVSFDLNKTSSHTVDGNSFLASHRSRSLIGIIDEVLGAGLTSLRRIFRTEIVPQLACPGVVFPVVVADDLAPACCTSG